MHKAKDYKRIYSIIVAAGKGLRVGGPIPKQLIKVGGNSVLEKSLRVWASNSKIDVICLVSPQDGSLDGEYLEIIEKVEKSFGKRIILERGGMERRDSVIAGLKAVQKDACEQQLDCPNSESVAVGPSEVMTLIHDAARPGITNEVINRNIVAMSTCKAVVTAVPCTDSVRIIDNSILKQEPLYPIIKSSVIERDRIYNVQTPQTFSLYDILEAYRKADEEGYIGTDDASVADFAGIEVCIVEGSYSNNKITTIKDVPMTTRVGTGYDVHKLVPDRALILCGTPVPNKLGLLGHSDADVATHAIMDALLGAAGMRDIGYHFPDNNDEYKDADSIGLLKKVKEIIGDCQINNIDVTIICERPRLSPYNEEMGHNVATALGIPDSAVNVKATTTEGLGFPGRGEGIAAIATCSIEGRF